MMKIEKVNDNQIRCTLTREDLADRQIKLSELAYGSEKARGLFRDMIQQANYEFGFEAEDIPLMVEAIPLSSESIILVITKVEYPEELDTRFSKFSEADSELMEESDLEYNKMEPAQGADDILDLFKKMRDAVQEKKDHKTDKEQTKENTRSKEESNEEPVKVITDLTKMFEFSNLDDVCRIAKVLSGYYEGENHLYKDSRKNRFFLLVHKNHHTPEEFNKVCNMISEYASQRSYSQATGAYFMEHGGAIIENNALQVLSQL